MELLQWLDSAWRIALTGVFALLPGSLVWLAVLGMSNLFRRLTGSRHKQIWGKVRPA